MNRKEFDSYVKQTGRKLYALAFRILSKQDEAEDAVQEVFIRLWKMGEKLGEYDSIDALATTMTKNYCIDQLRKSRQMVDLDDKYDDYSSSSPAEIMEKAESFLIVDEIINGLTPNYREIIKMHDIDGLSYEEISQKTGQNINTIRVNLSRARAMIRDEYKKYFNEKRRAGLIVK